MSHELTQYEAGCHYIAIGMLLRDTAVINEDSTRLTTEEDVTQCLHLGPIRVLYLAHLMMAGDRRIVKHRAEEIASIKHRQS